MKTCCGILCDTVLCCVSPKHSLKAENTCRINHHHLISTGICERLYLALNQQKAMMPCYYSLSYDSLNSSCTR